MIFLFSNGLKIFLETRIKKKKIILNWHLHSKPEVPNLVLLFKTLLKFFQGNLTANMCFTTLPSRERMLLLFTLNHYFWSSICWTHCTFSAKAGTPATDMPVFYFKCNLRARLKTKSANCPDCYCQEYIQSCV